jgi:pimeloyl-ACP methyl ester carboxylesterase
VKRLERRIDVTRAANLEQPIEMAVTIFLPDPASVPRRPVVIFAAPGGGYSRAYYYLDLPGRQFYSEAEYHVSRGTIYVAIDHVGVGESTVPDLSRITFETFAATHNSCVRQIAALIEDGTLDPGFPACPALFRIGMGQSMGAGVTILTQGRFATFDAIAPIGVSAIYCVLPQPTRDQFEFGKQRYQHVRVGDQRHSHETISNEGFDFVYPFFWEDVPAELVKMDTEGGYPKRRTSPVFGSLTIPNCGTQMMTPGCFKEEAAQIKVPVFIGLGERDSAADPHAEPSAYPQSTDISLYIVPRMAHMHNFASTREQLWARFHRWTRLIADSAAS